MAEYSIHNETILRCQNGDRQAQNQLYGLYSKAMYNICRRMMADEDEARDLLQDIFIEVFTKVGKLKEIGTFSAWIKRIAVNKCINALKKKRVFTVSIEDIDIIENDGILEKEFIHQEARKVMQAIDQISDGCRTVLNLYLFEGYDHAEISQILGISESASKSQLSKAKQKIKQILESENIKNYGNG